MGRAAIAVAAAVVAANALTAAAQSWPTRPITLVVTFADGGPADGAVRLIAGELSDKLGQRVLIENRGGAGGNIGVAAVAKAPPDGYTFLLVTAGPGAINKAIHRTLSYDPETDLSPVALIATVPQVVLVSPKLPVASLAELVAYGKRQIPPLHVGNPGYGTAGHLAALLFARRTELRSMHIAYRGVAPLLADVINGQIEFGFANYAPLVRDMKALAVTARERLAILPDVPTGRETGVADVVAESWYGLLAPAGTPREIVMWVNAIVTDIFKSPRGRELADSLGMQVLGGTPEDMAAFMARELVRWEPVIRDAHIVIE